MRLDSSGDLNVESCSVVFFMFEDQGRVAGSDLFVNILYTLRDNFPE